MNIIEQIRAEIERRIKILREDDVVRQNCSSAFLEGKIYGYEDLLPFLDTLQEQDVKDVTVSIKEYYGEELPFEDERTKAAYYFFSDGRSFELRQIEEEKKQHITALLDNYKKGQEAGYKKALLALKDGKIGGSPVMTEFLTKLLGSNFGFGPSINFSQQSNVDLEKEIDKFYGVVRKNGKTYDKKDGEFCFDPKDDETYEHELRFARHFFNLGKNAK